MKASRTCPKCSGQRFFVNGRVGFVQKMYKGQAAYVAAIPVVTRRHEGSPGFFGTSSSVEELGTYESWSCIGCGYTELYASDIAGLAESGAGRIVEPAR